MINDKNLTNSNPWITRGAKWYCCLVVIITLVGNKVIAEDAAAQTAHTAIVDSIEIKGLGRTKALVVQRELLVKQGEPLDAEALLESVQRLKNTQLFQSVLPYVENLPNNRVKVIIDISERWTTIPFFTFSQGGGTRRFSVGAYDINHFGRFLEMGLLYESWDGESGGAFWFRNPRFLDERLILRLELRSLHRPRRLFEPYGEQLGAYVLYRQLVDVFVQKEWRDGFSVGVGALYHQDRFQDPLYTPALDAGWTRQITTPDTTDAVSTRLQMDIGKLNYDNYLVRGRLSQLMVELAPREFGSQGQFVNVYWENAAHYRLPYYANLSLHAVAATTTSTQLQNMYFVGGFAQVRGYADGQFLSRAFWQVNAEYRIPSVRTSWVVLQHIFFFDVVQAQQSLSSFALDAGQLFPSTGIGFRLISPKIYRFNGRLDIAIPWRAKNAAYVSFGAQQFF